MMHVTRTLALAVCGLALVLGGHAAVSAAPLFEARGQMANVANRGHHVRNPYYNRHYEPYFGTRTRLNQNYRHYRNYRHYSESRTRLNQNSTRDSGSRTRLNRGT